MDPNTQPQPTPPQEPVEPTLAVEQEPGTDQPYFNEETLGTPAVTPEPASASTTPTVGPQSPPANPSQSTPYIAPAPTPAPVVTPGAVVSPTKPKNHLWTIIALAVVIVAGIGLGIFVFVLSQ